LPTEGEELKAKLVDALDLLGTDGCMGVEAFTNLMLLHAAHERAPEKMAEPDEAKAAFALLGGSKDAVPMAEAAERLAGMCALMPLDGAAVERETEAVNIEEMLATFDYEDKGHLHFDCFARVVMRSLPSPW
jgi:hypothetical protein